MITQEELVYIADHWLPHQYFHKSFWGKDLTHANPEAYLAMKRGIQFIERKTIYNECYINYFSYTSKRSYITYTYEIEKDRNIIIFHAKEILNEWIRFMNFNSYNLYREFIHKFPNVLRWRIRDKLFSINNYERIYTL